VGNLNLNICNKRLIDEVKERIKWTEYTYKEIARFSGLPKERLHFLLYEAKNPKIYKEELEVLTLALGVGTERVLGLPYLSDRILIMQEYAFMVQKGELPGSVKPYEDKPLFNPKDRCYSEHLVSIDNRLYVLAVPEKYEHFYPDDMRLRLFTLSIRKCLDKYESLRN